MSAHPAATAPGDRDLEQPARRPTPTDEEARTAWARLATAERAALGIAEPAPRPADAPAPRPRQATEGPVSTTRRAARSSDAAMVAIALSIVAERTGERLDVADLLGRVRALLDPRSFTLAYLRGLTRDELVAMFKEAGTPPAKAAPP